MRLWLNDSATPEGKYPILLRRDGSPVEHPFFAMLARDPAAPVALRAYADEAQRLGYDPAMVEDIRALADEYEQYRTQAGPGDPDAPRHRKDDPVVIAWARSLRRNRATENGD